MYVSCVFLVALKILLFAFSFTIEKETFLPRVNIWGVKFNMILLFILYTYMSVATQIHSSYLNGLRLLFFSYMAQRFVVKFFLQYTYQILQKVRHMKEQEVNREHCLNCHAKVYLTLSFQYLCRTFLLFLVFYFILLIFLFINFIFIE